MTKNTHRIKRTGLRRLLASVTALSVVLGNCCFVMAQPEPVYICGYEIDIPAGTELALTATLK